MKRMKILYSLLILILGGLFLIACATQSKIYKEDVESLIKSKSETSEYEDSAKTLRELHAKGIALCDGKQIEPSDCRKLNIFYQETREAFIEQGEKLKIFILVGSPKNEKAYADAKERYKNLRFQLDDYAKKIGID